MKTLKELKEKESNIWKIKENRKNLEEDIFKLVEEFEENNAVSVDAINFRWDFIPNCMHLKKVSATVTMERI